MSPAGVVFLVLFIVAVIAGAIYGLYLYRKDRQCLKKNWIKCKSCKLCQKLKNCCCKRRQTTLNFQTDESAVSNLMPFGGNGSA